MNSNEYYNFLCKNKIPLHQEKNQLQQHQMKEISQIILEELKNKINLGIQERNQKLLIPPMILEMPL